MRKNKLFIFLLTLILSVSCLSSIAFGHSINIASDDTELNWYFVNRGKDTLPECPKEATGLLSKYDAYYLGDTNEKVVYLTFDEGYENGYTPKILDILRDEKVSAAFFVVKPYIVSNPEIIKRMSDEGHLVCNHSNHHPSMATVTDPEKFKAEFTDVEEAYKEVVGTDMPKFFRPPMGKYSINSLKKTKDLGYKTIFWSFAYKDWIIDNQPSEEEAIKKITNGVHPGCIMLIHAVSKTNTAVLKTVIEQIRADGYEFKPLTELPEYQAQ
ncbi:delta-lactam-biosynthetic de-N-acetylase [Clostridium saudiense]|uniref:delta-lactam-biosynthetic de-N-acetylase n=1 Tax=Clostridium saudiense TaxID=1414720 RepID=UPI0018A91CB5|nr:delta-lactam-biosynthetic de-N-acetylase [Clostridium saudiense]